jgi:hypothetical protein
MGFYFRKSVSFGPVRFNFSKSGVGVSVGVKGARISTGPRGTYVHAGRNGFYYRQRIDTPGPHSHSQVHWQPNVQSSTSGSHVIQTADVSRLVETSSTDILQQINARSQQIRYAPFVLIATLAATVLVFLLINFCANTLTARFVHDHELANTIVTIADFVFSGITLVVGLIFSEKTRKGDMLRLTTPLFYELEQDALDRFSTIQKACETLARSIRIWRVETDAPTFDWKRNAGASSLVTRKLINVERLQPPYIATNVDVWNIKLNNQTLFFFPDHVFVWQGGRYGAVSYESLDISFAPTLTFRANENRFLKIK